jgi:DNA polymerase/3'-5' exonuclease PolX
VSDKPNHQRVPLAQAQLAAQRLIGLLEPFCERIQIAGSIRRQRALVGDIELICIPKYQETTPPGEMFPQSTNMVNAAIQQFISSGALSLRVKRDGTVANGDKVKLLYDHHSNISLDLFITDTSCWFSTFVCRTGGKDNNTAIATKAKVMGYRWMMAGEGFRHLQTNEIVAVSSEQAVFAFVGMPYLRPEDRA